MTTQPTGLNRYNRKASQKFCFPRFQWVLDGVLARSGQPGYKGYNKDEDHTIKPYELGFLRANRIVCVISANSRYMDTDGMQRLFGAGIEFHHLGIADYKAPTPAQLQAVAETVEECRTRRKNRGATLIYCGFGEGRTGTYVAAWAMLKHLADLPAPDKRKMCSFRFLREQFGVERAPQAQMIKAVVTGRRFSQVSVGSVPDTFGIGSMPGNAAPPNPGAFSMPGNVSLPKFGSGGSSPFQGPKPNLPGLDMDMF